MTTEDRTPSAGPTVRRVEDHAPIARPDSLWGIGVSSGLALDLGVVAGSGLGKVASFVSAASV